MSVRPHGATRLPQDGSSWNLIFDFFLNLTRKAGTARGDVCTYMIISRLILRRMWNVLDKIVEEIKTYLCSINFIQKSYRLCENMDKYGRKRAVTDNNIIWRMHIAWWITKASDTHSEYVILIAILLQQWLHERTAMLRLYVNYLYC